MFFVREFKKEGVFPSPLPVWALSIFKVTMVRCHLVAGHFIAGVHVLALIVIFFWFFIGYPSFFTPTRQFILSPYSLAEVGVFGFALLLSVTTLIISCPCVLGLATPSAIMAGTGKGAENGILFKGADAVEASSKLNAVVFDKTGTLTKGEPSVTDVYAMEGFVREDVLRLAAITEKPSEHPLGEQSYGGPRRKDCRLEIPMTLRLYPVTVFGQSIKGRQFC